MQKCFLHHPDKLSSVPGSPRRRKEPAVQSWPLTYTCPYSCKHIYTTTHTHIHTHIIYTNTHTPTHTYIHTHHIHKHTYLFDYYSHILCSMCIWENYNWALTSKFQMPTIKIGHILLPISPGLGQMTSSPQELLVKPSSSDQVPPETSDLHGSSPPGRNPGQQSCVGRKNQGQCWQQCADGHVWVFSGSERGR